MPTAPGIAAQAELEKNRLRWCEQDKELRPQEATDSEEEDGDNDAQPEDTVKLEGETEEEHAERMDKMSVKKRKERVEMPNIMEASLLTPALHQPWYL